MLRSSSSGIIAPIILLINQLVILCNYLIVPLERAVREREFYLTPIKFRRKNVFAIVRRGRSQARARARKAPVKLVVNSTTGESFIS